MDELALVEQFPYAGLFTAFLLGSLGFPFPEDVILAFCGVLIQRDVVTPVPALFISYAGVIASDFVIFALGRKYGRSLMTHRKFHGVLPPERFAAVEKAFKRYGTFILFGGRFFWCFRAKLFLAAGVMGLPPRKFLIVDALAALVTVPVMVGVGYTGDRHLERLALAFRERGRPMCAMFTKITRTLFTGSRPC